METAAEEIVSAVSSNTADSPTLPSTPPTLPQVYSINSRLIARGTADRMHRTSLCDYCDLSAPLIQADCCHLAALISSTGDSTLAVPGGQSNNLDNQCQDMEGSSQNVQRVAPNRDTFGGDEN